MVPLEPLVLITILVPWMGALVVWLVGDNSKKFNMLQPSFFQSPQQFRRLRCCGFIKVGQFSLLQWAVLMEIFLLSPMD